MSKRIPVSYLQACFDYHPKSGMVFWRRRPRNHFATEHGWKIFNSRFAGMQITGKLASGYLETNLHYDGQQHVLFMHVVIWAISMGKWPTHEVDHRNGERDDNRWENLRAATSGQQKQNKKIQSNNTSGFIGVSWFKSRSCYRATIQIKRKQIHLGYFEKPEEAHQAYLEAKKKYHLFHPEPVTRQ